MKLELISDFRDFYDHAFHLFGDDLKPFYRNMKTEMSKIDQFNLLINAGQNVPVFGKLSDIIDKNFQGQFVVYDDVYAHAGDGKRLISYQEALAEPEDIFASAYIPSSDQFALTWRWLQVGDHPFLLEYISHDDWRSNCGQVQTRILMASDVRSVVPQIPYPLWSIDYVPLAHGKNRIALDFNTSPGLSKTGVEEFMTPTEIVEAITRAHNLLGL